MASKSRSKLMYEAYREAFRSRVKEDADLKSNPPDGFIYGSHTRTVLDWRTSTPEYHESMKRRYGPPKRLDIKMNCVDAIMALSRDNKEARNALTALVIEAKVVNPPLHEIEPLWTLDKMRCYDEMIARFFKYLCEENPVTMIGLLKAVDMEIISELQLFHAIDGDEEAFDVEEVLADVQKQDPEFGYPTITKTLSKP